MNCDDVTAILDDHTHQRLTAAERCALDEHLVGCEPCAHAWRAQSALLALALPATPLDLIDRMLREMDARASARPRRARTRVVIVGAVLAASAALAAVTTALLMERKADRPATARSALDGADETPASPDLAAPPSPSTIGAGADAPATAVEYVDVDLFIVQRIPPVYPKEALGRKLDGSVTVRYTIDEHGAVRDAEALDSSDPVFEAAAVAAVSQWKYLPRVVAGKRVAVGVQTIIRFQLEQSLPPAAAKATKQIRNIPLPDQPRYADFQAFDRGIALAWQRAADDDLRGAELELDELRATYELDDFHGTSVWTFYGYIYTQYGDYGRAIDAYQKATEYDKAGYFSTEWTALANLYFARHQYDRALKTLLAYKQSVAGRISPEATVLIEKLRALGVTEETL